MDLWRKGEIFSFKWFLPVFVTHRGGGGRHPVDLTGNQLVFFQQVEAHARQFISCSRARQTARLALSRTSRAPMRTNARQGLHAHTLEASFTTDSVLAWYLNVHLSRGHSIEHRLKNESCSFLASKVSCLRVLACRFFVLHWWDYKNLFEMKNLWVVHNCVWFYCVYPGFFFCFYKFFLCALNQGIFILSYRVLNCRLWAIHVLIFKNEWPVESCVVWVI